MTGVTCSIEGCTKKHDARGYCPSHYNRWKRYGDPLASAPKTVRTCDVEGCDRIHRSNGYCNLHTQRLYRHGDPVFTVDVSRKPCAVDGCEVLAKGYGYCTRHLRRVQKHGNPSIVAAGGRPIKGEFPGWAAVHKRIRRVQGPARMRSCVDCDKRAAEWSYDNRDANELIDAVTGCPYSLDLSHYSPRCIPCHRKFDSANRVAA